MNLTTLGELSWFLWAILLYNTATAIAEGILIPVNISCHPSIRLDTDDRIFSLKLHICNITITVDNDEPRVTRFSDLWNVSVIGNFSRKPFVEGGGHVDCSMVTCNIKCAIYGYFLGMEYVSQFYTPHIEYGVVSKTIKKAPEMLICEAVSGPTTRNMRWQNKTGGGMFKDIPTVIEHEQDTCLTTSKLKYDGNVQAQYRCMFGDIEVGSTRVSGKDIDLSVHFFWSTMIILYVPFLFHQLLPTVHLLSRLTSNSSKNVQRRLMRVTAWIPLILCAIFMLWWIILFLIWRTTDYLRFFFLEVTFYGLHSVAHMLCSLPDKNWSPLDKWRRVLCFVAFINPVICWVVMKGQEVEGTSPLEIAWWFLTVFCSIVQVQTQF
ncbi:uncharacterized protein [Haliotis asinina]